MTLSPARAYAFQQSIARIDPVWRELPQHCLLYSAAGLLTLEVGTIKWLLPPGYAAWIEALTPIAVSADQPATCHVVLFAPDFVPSLSGLCRVFAVPAQTALQITVLERFGPDRVDDDPEADRAFVALAQQCAALAHPSAQFWLPQASSPELKQVLAFVAQHPERELSLASLSQQAQLSEQTLARRFDDELGLDWRNYQARARMMMALQWLSIPGASVDVVAARCGFGDAGTFAETFADFAQQTPSQFQARFNANSPSGA